MPEENSIIPTTQCLAPEVSALLTAYCFGRASEAQQRVVETHLLDCRVCWEETRRLEQAIQILDTDPTLPKTLTATDLAQTFGISSKLEALFGGHLIHALLCSTIYAALFAVAVLVEVAYHFDQHGRTGIKLAIVAFIWILATSLAGLWLDWRLTLRHTSNGWAVSAGIFLFSAAALFAFACLFLPTTAVTELNWQAYTAQAAYLKTICYFLILQAIFLLPSFHFVLAMQRELHEGHHRLALELLTGDKLSVAPRGTIYPKFSALAVLLFVTIAISLFLHHNLMGNLRPGQYMNLFANLVQLRLILFFLLAAVCLVWYYRMLNELKRECLLAESPRLQTNSAT